MPQIVVCLKAGEAGVPAVEPLLAEWLAGVTTPPLVRYDPGGVLPKGAQLKMRAKGAVPS